MTPTTAPRTTRWRSSCSSSDAPRKRKSSSPSPSGSRREARSDRARAALAACAGVTALAARCRAVEPAGEWPVRFVDVSGEAGLTHPITYGDVARKRFIIETNGCGVAMIDPRRGRWVDR
jgi:hypothetical protein